MKRAADFLALAWLLTVAMLAFAAPLIATANPNHPVADPLLSPRTHFPLGTDGLGRDLWSRMLYGCRISPGAAFLAALLTLILGSLLGFTAAAFGGLLDRLISASINAALAVPALLLAMLLVAGFGPGITTVILAIGLGGAPAFARVTRTLSLQLMEKEYITAAESLGATRLQIAIRHLLPNAAGQIVFLATTHYAWAFLGVTTLTFLGLAGDPSLPDWGAILNQGRVFLVEAPWLVLTPGLAITLTILAIHRIGASFTEPNLPARIR
ncbi:MAG: ABC transporter permease [Anaerolineales bacterium]|jgi:peptide/nickel transport system permease protein